LNHAASREEKEEGRRQLRALRDSNVGKLQILEKTYTFQMRNEISSHNFELKAARKNLCSLRLYKITFTANQHKQRFFLAAFSASLHCTFLGPSI